MFIATKSARAPFSDPHVTATGERRAEVMLAALRTLWFNTGTVCNLSCARCYMESGPRNDRLAALGRDDVAAILAEARANHPELEEIGFTGGEPFMNRDLPDMLADVLALGWRALVLTNGTKPMSRPSDRIAELNRRYPGRIAVRVSLDHHTAAGHEEQRGAGSWQPALAGLRWLDANGFALSVAGRTLWGEDQGEARRQYATLFAGLGIDLDASDPAQLVLFPEMGAREQVPEITERCWGILGKTPDSVMCASSRMVVKRKGAARPAVVACTLLPYDLRFELGPTLSAATRAVMLNHRHCAEFCVLGGASCGRRDGGP